MGLIASGSDDCTIRLNKLDDIETYCWRPLFGCPPFIYSASKQSNRRMGSRQTAMESRIFDSVNADVHDMMGKLNPQLFS